MTIGNKDYALKLIGKNVFSAFRLIFYELVEWDFTGVACGDV